MVHTPEVSATRPPGAGKSSFDLIEPARLLGELPLSPGITFLDLGCGAGNYTLAVAEVIGAHGVVVALDLWPPGIEALEERAAAAGRRNIRAQLADISKLVPLGDHSVDVCLLATVLHDLAEFALAEGALRRGSPGLEARRHPGRGGVRQGGRPAGAADADPAGPGGSGTPGRSLWLSKDPDGPGRAI